MDIKDPKDIAKLAHVCRKHGISHIKIGDIEVHMGPEPLKKAKDTKTPASMSPSISLGSAITEDTQIVGGLTEEQLLFYSAQGAMRPEDMA